MDRDAGRQYFIELARGGLRMPIGADLVLHEYPDPEAIALDGWRLGQVIEGAARRYRTPLAVPLMDLRLEKADLLRTLGVPESQVDAFHFAEPPAEDAVSRVAAATDAPFASRNQAHIDSVRFIARNTSLLPIGMAIGPFSLMTKLMADPITAVALAGMGLTSEDDAAVLTAERCLELAELTVARSVVAQVEAGARAMLICEPAAGIVYVSPKQIASGSDVFERFVMQPALRLKRLLDGAAVDLIFHDCGELSPAMVEQFGKRIHPTMLSLGSSRRLWEDAALVPADVVLFGNLPTKTFYSDGAMPLEKVEELTRSLIGNMRATGHAHIVGSECDVLHVPGAAETIRRKLDLMLTCGA